MRDILEDVRRELNLICIGDSEKYPAASCKEVYDCNSTAPSGNYWIRNSTGGILQVHCLMETHNCGDTRGGWMRAEYINIRGEATTCPEGLTTYTPSSKSICSSVKMKLTILLSGFALQTTATDSGLGHHGLSIKHVAPEQHKLDIP